MQNEQAYVPVKMEGGAPGVPWPDLPLFSEYGKYGYHFKGDVGGYSDQLFLFDFGTVCDPDVPWPDLPPFSEYGQYIILKGMSVATLAKQLYLKQFKITLEKLYDLFSFF